MSGILEFVIALSILIVLHEMGHFFSSKLCGIEVEEFGIGYPPRLAHLFTIGNTKYTLNWIPFGGFVLPKGQDDASIPDGMAAAPAWKRLIILISGPLMNLLVGILLYSIVFAKIGAPDLTRVQIVGVADNSPAQEVGILPGDIVVMVNDINIDSTDILAETIQANLGEEIIIVLQRESEEQMITLKAVPRLDPPPNEGSLGVQMTNPLTPIPFYQAVPTGIRASYEQIKQLFLLPGNLIRGAIQPEEARVLGPVGIYSLYDNARSQDEAIRADANAAPYPAVNTLSLMAIISVALGITNLLPIPALDGGRIIFILIEIIAGRRLPAKFENAANAVFFLLLIFFMVYVTMQDILNPVMIP
jgi:regulator of sigma E protease